MTNFKKMTGIITILLILILGITACSVKDTSDFPEDAKADPAMKTEDTKKENKPSNSGTDILSFLDMDFSDVGCDPNNALQNTVGNIAFDENYIYYTAPDTYSLYRVDYNGQNPEKIASHYSCEFQFLNVYKGNLYGTLCETRGNTKHNNVFRLNLDTLELETFFDIEEYEDRNFNDYDMTGAFVVNDTMFCSYCTRTEDTVIMAASLEDMSFREVYRNTEGPLFSYDMSVTFTTDGQTLYGFARQRAAYNKDQHSSILLSGDLQELANGGMMTDKLIDIRFNNTNVFGKNGICFVNNDEDKFIFCSYDNLEHAEESKDFIKLDAESSPVLTDGMPYEHRSRVYFGTQMLRKDLSFFYDYREPKSLSMEDIPVDTIGSYKGMGYYADYLTLNSVDSEGNVTELCTMPTE